MTTFGACVFMANFILAIHAKTFEKIGIFLLLLGPISYFFFYGLTS